MTICHLQIESVNDCVFLTLNYNDGHKQNKPTLDEELMQYRSISQNSLTIIVRYNLRGKRIYENHQFLIQSGSPISINSLFFRKKNLIAFKENFNYVKRNRAVVEFELETDKSSHPEKTFIFNVRLVPEYDHNGHMISVLGFIHNITKYKELEKSLQECKYKLAQAADTARFGYWELDHVTNKLIWSPEVYHIFEVSPEIAPMTNGILSLIHPADRDKVCTGHSELIGNRIIYKVEFRLLYEDGRKKYLLQQSVNHFDETGIPIKTYGTIQDITELKEKEFKLLAAMEQAEESSRLKSSFLAIIGHEIRTPLNAILGFLSLLKNEPVPLSDNQIELMNFVEEAAAKLVDILDRIIDLSKITSKAITINPSAYNPHDIHYEKFEKLKELRTQAGKDHLNLKFEAENNSYTIEYYNDTDKIEQILDILIDNSMKFTSSGEIIFRLTFIGKEMLAFSVTDSGIGIPKDRKEAIFEPFVQADGSLSRAYEGLGIGLSTARKFANAMGGELMLRSNFGKGSTFILQLPAVYSGNKN